MKLTTQPKKIKSALGKVSKNKVMKKRDKDVTVMKNKAAALELACESLTSPEKDIVTKSLKKSKLPATSTNLFQKPTRSSKKVDISSPLKRQKQPDSPSLPVNEQKKSKKDKKKTVLESSDINISLEKAEKKSKLKEGKKKVDLGSEKIVVKSESKDSDATSCSLNQHLLEGVCSGVLKVVSLGQENIEKKDLFGSQPQPINLQITVYKVPKTSYRLIRCLVPNPTSAMEPEVCLIVPDLKRGRKRDTTFAELLLQYEEKLQECGVKGIKQIIPFTQMRTEYAPFEMKRRLASMFDVFLCDGRIHGHCIHFLGKAFEKAKKIPIPIHAVSRVDGKINFQPNLQTEVNDAIRKVTLTLHSHGTSYSIPVGHSALTHNQLADNVQAVWKVLEKELPGGVQNIRAAYLKGPKTSAVPLYASLVPPKNVPVAKLKVANEPVEDELSTLPGCRVEVYPTGEVKIKRVKSKEDKAFLKLNPKMALNDKKAKKRKKAKKEIDRHAKRLKAGGATTENEEMEDAAISIENNQVDNVSGDDENDYESDNDFKDVESAEAAYLSQWSESTSMKELEEEENKSKDEPKKMKNKNKSSARLAGKTEGKELAAKKGISQRYSKGKKTSQMDKKSKLKAGPKAESKAKSKRKA